MGVEIEFGDGARLRCEGRLESWGGEFSGVGEDGVIAERAQGLFIHIEDAGVIEDADGEYHLEPGRYLFNAEGLWRQVDAHSPA